MVSFVGTSVDMCVATFKGVQSNDEATSERQIPTLNSRPETFEKQSRFPIRGYSAYKPTPLKYQLIRSKRT